MTIIDEQIAALTKDIADLRKQKRAAARPSPQRAKPKPKPKPRYDRTLIFIINGENVDERCGKAECLSAPRARALESSQNLGRSPEEWEVRDEQGVRLVPSETVESQGLTDGTRLFLSLAIGCGGS